MVLLSPKHGVNPSLGICFFCGKADTVILFGSMRGKLRSISRNPNDLDPEAPRQICIDYNPCPKCKKAMTLGIVFIETTATQPSDERPAIQKSDGIHPDLYPTGRWSILKRSALHRLPVNEKLSDRITKEGRCYIDPEAFKMLGFADIEPTYKNTADAAKAADA